jgi:UDP-N-acetylglucosamine 4,6-dehydratase/5-epimerase
MSTHFQTNGNSLLITGGTGFFGQAFTRHCLYMGVERICIFSRSESNQAKFRAELNDDPRLRWFIGDVRDKERLQLAFRGVKTVVHAAALKRIEVGAYAPDEMVKTNIMGTLNVVEAAQAAGVKRVVYLSSDKAYQPISPYGQSKALGESIVLNANNLHGEHGPVYTAVRYGNIWGSTGSVVPIWRDLIARGATKVPVTSPSCTRFFMRIEEAVELVWYARKGLIIPESLPSYRLGDLADAMGVDMEIKGLPPWEKIHEGMRDGLTSDRARRMTIEELKVALA